MRKLMLKMSITADGYVCGPNGEMDWLFISLDASVKKWLADTLWQAGVHIMGSRTYYDMKAYWPNSNDILAAPMNEIPKIVFTRLGIDEVNRSRLTTQAITDSPKSDLFQPLNSPIPPSSNWHHTIVADGDLEEEIQLLKKQAGKNILAHGGASFVQNLMKYNLIDEYRLVVHPVFIGRGISIFSTLPHRLDLKLMDSTVFKSGVVAKVYRPVDNSK
ncbi:MAG: dihydrofolate reductase family protein [Saprospiraceae bacterium]